MPVGGSAVGTFVFLSYLFPSVRIQALSQGSNVLGNKMRSGLGSNYHIDIRSQETLLAATGSQL